MNGRYNFKSKQHAMQMKKPVFACAGCRTKHDAPMRARCTGKGCNYTGTAMPSTPGVKRNNQCPNCARMTLKNEMIKPLGCSTCGQMEFIKFDSTAEFNYFAQLAMLQDSGQIADLRLQVPFVLVKRKDKPALNRKYIADFTFHEVLPDGSKGPRKVVDVKGSKDHIDPVAKLKIAIVEYMHDVKVEIVA